MDNIINIKSVGQRFGEVVALDNINMDIKKGEIIGFLGPSGSGKTTLVKAIIGMFKPTSGKITVFGTDVPSLAIVDRIGYMAQADALYDDLNAYENLLFFGSLYGLRGIEAKKRADEVLALVLLSEHAKRQVRNYSGGMKRRLSLAIALFHRPELLILDEPTVGIDPVLRRQFWNEFSRLQKNGTTIVVTTHVMDEAEHCDRLSLIRSGLLIALGTPEELKQSSGEKTIEGAFLYYSQDEKEEKSI
jgi:ABC-2 type transport system ATP-binding protein